MHHLDSARSVEYDPNDRGVSSIFVVNYNKFKTMKGKEIQAIFRHRHILVLDVEVDEMAFDIEGLSTLGSMTLSRQMQG
jgi:hypothetical protein